jgi:DNA repair exonuclease SbcCD nuclease subunit
MAADFALDHVVIAGNHDSEDGDGYLLPDDF